MDVIILAGGKGSRMDDSLPKPLVVVKGKPILAWQIDYFLSCEKTDKIVLAVGYRSDEIKNFVEKNYAGKNIELSVEDSPLGTAGAIRKALLMAETDRVIVLNCDDVTDISLEKLNSTAENSICVVHPRLSFGLVKEVDGFAAFEEKPLLPLWVSCGWYVLNREELIDVMPVKGSIEYDVFPKVKFKVIKHEGFWQPLNSKKEISEFEKRDIPNCLL